MGCDGSRRVCLGSAPVRLQLERAVADTVPVAPVGGCAVGSRVVGRPPSSPGTLSAGGRRTAALFPSCARTGRAPWPTAAPASSGWPGLVWPGPRRRPNQWRRDELFRPRPRAAGRLYMAAARADCQMVTGAALWRPVTSAAHPRGPRTAAASCPGPENRTIIRVFKINF